jgi:nitroreductase
MVNPTKNHYQINELIKQRWSTRAFSNKPLEKEKLNSILEAARWAPSAFNEQPWRFIIGQNGDSTYNNILKTLVDWNKLWGGNAPVLILNIAKKTFTANNKENGTSGYDLGQAVGFMILEIVNQGLHSHQMSGFDPEKAAELFNIPDDYQAVSVTALGYYGDVKELPQDIAGMESKPRERFDINSMVFSESFGKSLEL